MHPWCKSNSCFNNDNVKKHFEDSCGYVPPSGEHSMTVGIMKTPVCVVSRRMVVAVELQFACRMAIEWKSSCVDSNRS